MKKSYFIILYVLIFSASPSKAGFLDNIMENLDLSSQQGLEDKTVISGLKEALSLGTDKAVKKVSSIDGYLANQAIKIPMPEKIQKVADVLATVGFQEQVDNFIISMNRAAEKSAPQATSYFVNALKEMTFEDAKEILNGGNTAATDYFKLKKWDKLYNAFRPAVSSSMNDIGVTRFYKDMMDKYTSLPFVKEETLDLDNYVTNKSLDGLFYMIAREEEKIRTDPPARVTDLLKKVFQK
ncbi:MAG TPA: DUF4197 domain-containing protein [Nitrospiria bacterium]|jgi:hypothetical protein